MRLHVRHTTLEDEAEEGGEGDPEGNLAASAVSGRAPPAGPSGSTFTAGEAQALFSVRFDVSGNRVYDVAKDGRRFLVNLSKPSPNVPIVVMLGLDEEIRTLAARHSEAR